MTRSISFWTILIVAIAASVSLALKKPEVLGMGICIGIILLFILPKKTNG